MLAQQIGLRRQIVAVALGGGQPVARILDGRFQPGDALARHGQFAIDRRLGLAHLIDAAGSRSQRLF